MGEIETRLKVLVDQAEAVVKTQEALIERQQTEDLALAALEAKWGEARAAISRFKAAELELQHQLEDVAKRLKELLGRSQDLDAKLHALRRQKQALGLDRLEDRRVKEVDADAMDLEEPNPDLAALPSLLPEELEALGEREVAQMQAEANEAREQAAEMRPNLAALGEYQNKAQQFVKAVTEHDAVQALCDEKRLEHDALRRRRLEEFMAGFGAINGQVAAMYKMITLEDGDADLQLLDSVDPFAEGLAFRVRPPKKSWKIIAQLSGGEKTLASLALVFALHAYKPTPIYIMDEIDAALDFKNVSIIANYVKSKTKNAQFLVISLRNYMFEMADKLIGIYKTDNQTKSIPIEPVHFALPAVPKDS